VDSHHVIVMAALLDLYTGIQLLMFC